MSKVDLNRFIDEMDSRTKKRRRRRVIDKEDRVAVIAVTPNKKWEAVCYLDGSLYCKHARDTEEEALLVARLWVDPFHLTQKMN